MKEKTRTSPQDKIEHAVVIGAGIAGLVAARILHDRAAKVTLIERDPLTEDTSQHRGVPQGQHFHALMGAGFQVLCQLFPTLLENLDRAGIEIGDAGRDWLLFDQHGVWLPRFPYGVPSIGCSRAVFEQHVRRLLISLPNIELHSGQTVCGLYGDKRSNRISGVRLARKDDPAREEILRADLVVDASGRGSRTPAWLGELGYSPPPDEEVAVNIAYVSRLYRQPAGPPPDWQLLGIHPTASHGRRGGYIHRITDGLAMVTFLGLSGEKPPLDEAGFLEFARSLPQSHIYNYMQRATPAGEPCAFKFPSNRRRHYELIDQMPDGLVVLGDAVYMTTPTYGQGMMLPCLSAVELGRCLDEQREPSLRGLSQRFQKRLATLLAVPWSSVITEELRRPETVGPRPPWLSLIHWYSHGVLDLGAIDREVGLDIARVVHMLGSPRLLIGPSTVLKVLRLRLQQLATSSKLVGAPPTPDRTPSFIMNPHPLLQRSYAELK